MRVVNHIGEAEDVLQEAFLDAFCHLHTFKGQSTFGAWLKQIVVNKAINHLRQRKMQLVDIEGYGSDDQDIADDVPFDEEGLQMDVEPVSYTHLDVYKRQELSIGNIHGQLAFIVGNSPRNECTVRTF